MKLRSLSTVFAWTVSMTFAASISSAQIVHIDCGRLDGTTADTPMMAFNNISEFGLFEDLVFEDGMVSSINIDYSQITGAGNPAQTAVSGAGADYFGPYPAGLDGVIPDSTLSDSWFIFASNTATFTLGDLSSAATYDVLFYGARGNNGIMDNTFTATDGTGVLPVQTYAPFNNATDTVEFMGMVPDANGEIVITLAVGAGNTDFRGAVNYLRITETAGGFIVGDVNCDGTVDLLDVQPFVAAITNGVFDPKADINNDGLVDLLDVTPFVGLLL